MVGTGSDFESGSERRPRTTLFFLTNAKPPHIYHQQRAVATPTITVIPFALSDLSTTATTATMTTYHSLISTIVIGAFGFLAGNAAAFILPSPIRTSTQLQAFSVPDAVTNFYQTQPYVSAFLTCSIKASAADFVAQGRQSSQKAEDDANDTTAMVSAPQEQASLVAMTSSKVDLPRNLAFFTYGGIYQGCTQQYIFANIYPSWFGHWEDAVLRVAAQVGLDVLVLAPFVCLPILYGIRSLVGSASDDDNDGTPAQQTKWHQSYLRDVVQHQLLFKYWALWIPVNAIAFGVIPTHFRVAFIAAVSFVWVLVLSLTTSAEEATTTTTAGETDGS